MTPKRKTRAVFDSMKAAAAALGVSVGVLKKAKEAGAPGFVGSRVHGAEVEQWLATHKGALGTITRKEGLELELLEERVKDLRRHNEEKAGVLVDKAAVIGAIQRAGAAWHSARLRIEAQEPAKLVGINAVPEMAGQVKRLMDEVSGVLRSLGRELEGIG